MKSSKKLVLASKQQVSPNPRRFDIATFCKDRKAVERACEAAGKIYIVDGDGALLAVMRHEDRRAAAAQIVTAENLDHHGAFIVGVAAMGLGIRWEAPMDFSYFVLGPVEKRIPSLPRLDHAPRWTKVANSRPVAVLGRTRLLAKPSGAGAPESEKPRKRLVGTLTASSLAKPLLN